MDILSGRARGAGPALLRAGLCVAAVPYGAAMRLRRAAYRRGLLPATAADAAVVSIGNITTGGTGKTPMVAWTVARLREQGRSPAVVMRGYKSIGGQSDEAALLRSLTGAHVVVNADRVAGAAAAVAAGADVCVLDDGFQHQRLRRELDVVLIDATNPFGYGRCLPRGLLREPPGALRDAGAVVLTRSDRVAPERREQLLARLAALSPRAVLATCYHRATGVIDEAGQLQPVAALAQRRILAFCGLGNPGAFFTTLRKLGAPPAGELAFDDHAAYGSHELAAIAQGAADSRADVLVTTQKDGVKLTGSPLPLPVWQLAVQIEFMQGAAALQAAIRAAVAGGRPGHGGAESTENG